MGIIEGLINAGGSIATSVINNNAEDRRAQAQREWTEKQNDIQWQRDLDMWNMNNQYNSPGAQLQRMRDAGLNPLFNGLDSSSASPISAPQPLGYERASNPNGIANPVEAFLSGALDRAKIDNLNSKTAQQNNESLTETERRQNIIKEREGLEKKFQLYDDEHQLNGLQKEKMSKYLEYADDMYNALIDKDKAYADLANWQKQRIEELLPGEKEIQGLSIDDYAKKWKVWNAEIQHMAKQDHLIEKQAKYYLVSLLSSGFYGTGASAVNAFIWGLITEDPDLTPKDKETLKPIFVPSDDKGSNKKYQSNDLYKGMPAGNPRDPNTYKSWSD